MYNIDGSDVTICLFNDKVLLLLMHLIKFHMDVSFKNRMWRNFQTFFKCLSVYCNIFAIIFKFELSMTTCKLIYKVHNYKKKFFDKFLIYSVFSYLLEFKEIFVRKLQYYTSYNFSIFKDISTIILKKNYIKSIGNFRLF